MENPSSFHVVLRGIWIKWHPFEEVPKPYNWAVAREFWSVFSGSWLFFLPSLIHHLLYCISLESFLAAFRGLQELQEDITRKRSSLLAAPFHSSLQERKPWHSSWDSRRSRISRNIEALVKEIGAISSSTKGSIPATGRFILDFLLDSHYRLLCQDRSLIWTMIGPYIGPIDGR